MPDDLHGIEVVEGNRFPDFKTFCFTHFFLPVAEFAKGQLSFPRAEGLVGFFFSITFLKQFKHLDALGFLAVEGVPGVIIELLQFFGGICLGLENDLIGCVIVPVAG